VAKKILKINTKTKRAHNLRGAAATATGHSRAMWMNVCIYCINDRMLDLNGVLMLCNEMPFVCK